MDYQSALAIGVIIPLAGFMFLALFGSRLGKPLSGYVSVAAIGLSCVFATHVLLGWLGADEDARRQMTESAFRFDWGTLGSVPLTVGVKLDSLTIIMYFMVTFVAFWIHFFSLGYMEGHSDEIDGQSKYHRFFAYLSLFCFSMLGLVVSSSLLFMFIFWELVGLCSYLLIGFYFDKKFASDAAIKAFVVNRVGDFGFILGLGMVLFFLGTFDLEDAAAEFARQSVEGSGLFASPISLFGFGAATLMGIGLFCGAMGKSAQFPLHVWLPDAMAGPTPVSALIHAATMVAAGVYLVARVFRLLTPEAQMFVALIGCITLTITALIAVVQTDIKKVLAYSTLSQLGYMIFGMGCGAWVAALFHLMTHAFFKAMLFLGSGQVIEGCHHEQDIRKMGGLRKKMPVTCWTFFVGVLAIAGFGIPGAHLGLGGYFSKDEILAVAYERSFNAPGTHDGHDADEHARATIDGPQAPIQGGLPGAAVVLASLGQVQNNDLESAVDEASLQLDRDSGLPSNAQTPKWNPEGARQMTQSERENLQHHGAFIRPGDNLHAAGASGKAGIAASLPHLPKWMFWLPIVIAYVTPFYMMRCWWLTFCGTPRDEHVYHHAHEQWKMYVPLVVLAIGTVFCSYSTFRPLIADAANVATDAVGVVAFDGEAEHVAADSAMLGLSHGEGMNPHHALIGIVGFAWIIGMGIAWLIYRRGLASAERIRRIPLVAPIHHALAEKLYFDHVYNAMFVGGVKLCGGIAYLFDKVVIDGAVNLSAYFTRAIGKFTGRQLDMQLERGDFGLVDTLANGLAGVMLDVGTEIRRPQTGRIRNYILWTAGATAIGLLFVLYFDDIAAGCHRIVMHMRPLAVD